MIIGIDGNEANVGARVGVNVYAFELLRNIYKLQDEWKSKHEFIVFLKNNPGKSLPKETNYWKYKVIPGGGLWIIKKLTPHLFINPEKVCVFLSPSHYLPPLCRIPSVCSIMDLGYLENSGQFRRQDYWQLKYWTAWSLFISKYIISISKSTAKDIVRHYPFAQNKVMITYLGYDKDRFNRSILDEDVRRSKKCYGIIENYIMFLSTLKPSKNVERLIDAWAKIENVFPDVCLVIGGKKGWLYENIFAKVKDLGLDNRVRFIGFVDERNKAALLAGARVFLIPSLWEGFGLDALSALAVGTPVVASGRGSLPEVIGDAGIFVEPESVESIGLGIKKALTLSNKDRMKLVKKGFDQAKKFSWEVTARETLKILEEAGDKA